MTSDHSAVGSPQVHGVDAALTLTVTEAATMLGISRGLAYEMVRQERLPSLRLGRRVLVPRQALTAFLNEQRPPGGVM